MLSGLSIMKISFNDKKTKLIVIYNFIPNNSPEMFLRNLEIISHGGNFAHLYFNMKYRNLRHLISSSHSSYRDIDRDISSGNLNQIGNSL